MLPSLLEGRFWQGRVLPWASMQIVKQTGWHHDLGDQPHIYRHDGHSVVVEESEGGSEFPDFLVWTTQSWM
jgi:hypothetical protein